MHNSASIETRTGSLARARHRFDELAKGHASPMAKRAIQRIAWLYRIGQEARDTQASDRLGMRHLRARPLGHELHMWLKPERTCVADGRGIAAAIDHSLKRWTASFKNGGGSIDNNHAQRSMRPSAIDRKARLFCGTELAGQRVAMMSLVPSAKLNGHGPWVYLKDVLERLASRNLRPRKMPGREPDHMCSIMTCPNPEHDTCTAPSISRAKS